MNRTLSSFKKVLVASAALGFAVANTGCSRLEIGLNMAPRLVTNSIDDAFDFNGEKNSKIRAQIDTDLKVVKKPVAGSLIVLLKDIEVIFFEKTPTLENLNAVFNSYTKIQTTLLEGFKPTAELTLKDVSADEQLHFKSHNAKKFEKDLAEALNDKKFQKKTIERYEKIYDFLLNDVTNAQIETITAFSLQHKKYLNNKLILRKKFAESFYETMKNKEDTVALFYKQFSGKPSDDLTEEGRKEFVLASIQLSLDLWTLSNDKQKAYFRELLKKYILELEKISLQP